MSTGSDIKYKRLYTMDDFTQAENLQKEAWNSQDRDILPSHIMVAYKNMGEIWGAFSGSVLTGFSITFPTPDPAIFYAHMAAVKKEYRTQGIAGKLAEHTSKSLAKRKAEAVFWTYDALVPVNAHFYHSSLKAIGIAMAYDLYGQTASTTGRTGTPSHRVYCAKLVKQPLLKKADKKAEVHLTGLDESYRSIEKMLKKNFFISGFELSSNKLIFSEIKERKTLSTIRRIQKLIFIKQP